MVVFLGAAIEDAGVAGLADLPFELELEVAELILRDDVGAGVSLASVPSTIASRQAGGRLVAAKGVERRAVEEHPPLRLGLGRADGGGEISAQSRK